MGKTGNESTTVQVNRVSGKNTGMYDVQESVDLSFFIARRPGLVSE